MRSLAKLNLIREIEANDGKTNVSLASAAINTGTQNWLKHKIAEATKGLDGIKETEITFVEESPKNLNDIRHVVAIMSGKGGVGKSLITSLTALSLVRRGYDVGILDADITGPSIPRMFGVTDHPFGSETGFLPPVSKTGIAIMSINLLLPNEDDAAPLTVMQTLPLSGVIITFTPQDLAAMVVRKAVQMANKMNIPIKGVVENMSYFLLPDSGKRMELFGQSKGPEMASAAGAPLLAQFPIDPQIGQLCDEGNIERYYSEELDRFAEAYAGAFFEDAFV